MHRHVTMWSLPHVSPYIEPTPLILSLWVFTNRGVYLLVIQWTLNACMFGLVKCLSSEVFILVNCHSLNGKTLAIANYYQNCHESIKWVEWTLGIKD